MEPGNLVIDSTNGLHFAWSNNPHDLGWQSGQFLGYYWIDYYTTTPVQPQASDIAAAKYWGDDAPLTERGYPPSKIVDLYSKEVTAIGTFKFRITGGSNSWKSVPCLYIQDSNRVSAIRVIAGDAQDSPIPSLSIAAGDLVNVSAPMSTINGERTLGYLTQDGIAHDVSFYKVGTAAAPTRPFFMNVKSLGGAALGSTIGPTGASGANNVGLLVTIAGTVTSISTDERGVPVLYVDDGSNISGGDGIGCKVYLPGSSLQQGDFLSITGISSLEYYDPTPGNPGDESYIRVLIPR